LFRRSIFATNQIASGYELSFGGTKLGRITVLLQRILEALLIFLSLVPGLLVCYAVFRADIYEREPFLPLSLCFGAGFLAAFFAVAIERWGYVPPPAVRFPLLQAFFTAFLLIALNEELWKFGILRMGAFPSRFFNEPFDGIVYAVMIAMGFATAENIFYTQRFGLQTLAVRTFTAVPAHLAFAIVQGYFAGLAKFNPARRARLLTQGLVLSVLLHGFYDLLILQRWSDWLLVLASVALYMSLYFCGDLLREHLWNSPFRRRSDSKR
jgi:protease PrsW